MRRYYLLAYDVTADRRRAAVLKAVKAHGLGGQESAHECWLSKAERRELMRLLKRLIDPAEDRLLLLRIDPRSDVRQLGKGEVLADPSLFYLA
jgi:CRISPR-associated protein Cas2